MKCLKGFFSLLKFREVCTRTVAIKECKVNFLDLTPLSYALKRKCPERVSGVQPVPGTFIHVTPKLYAGM